MFTGIITGRLDYTFEQNIIVLVGAGVIVVLFLIVDIESVNLTLSLLVKERGITEELKATNPILWAKEMHNAKHCAEEIVLNEIIYH